MAGALDRDRHRRSRPPEAGLEKLASELGATSPRVVRRLGGGLGSATHLIAFDDRRLVLKRYPAESDMPGLEWRCLEFAHAAGLPAPAPLALDEDGSSWFGTPALAIELVPGRPHLTPTDVNTYIDDVATVLARIHSTSTAGADGPLLRAHAIDRWTTPDEVPEGLVPRALATRVVEEIVHRLPSADRGDTVLDHGDFHPGNLLWRRGRLTGVIDWSHARVGWRWWELAYFRMELAVLTDADAGDLLQRRYEALVGFTSVDQPLWDLVCLYNGHRWGHMWLMGYQEQGRPDLTIEMMRRRLTRLTQRALAALT